MKLGPRNIFFSAAATTALSLALIASATGQTTTTPAKKPAATQASYKIANGIHFQETTIHHPLIIIYLSYIPAAMIVKYHNYKVIFFKFIL